MTIKRVAIIGGGLAGLPVVVREIGAMAAAGCDSLYEKFRRPEYAPLPLLKRMVAAGRAGRKRGRGFYAYQEDG